MLTTELRGCVRLEPHIDWEELFVYVNVCVIYSTIS